MEVYMKDKIITYLFIFYIFIFSLLHLVIKDKDISENERRELSTFPVVSFNNEYITKLDKYLLDHFPLRENFRSLKANYNYHILNKLENNQIYLKNNSIYKSNYPTDKESIKYFINHINKTKKYFTDNNRVYSMIIPDKNYYLYDEDFLHIDYDYIYGEINKLDIGNIDLRNVLNNDDYYQTDTHWRQEKLDKVVRSIINNLDFKYQKILYETNIYDNFYGVYYGESAINRKPEQLIYLSNNIIDNVEVSYLENKNLKEVYNTDKLSSLDSYEVYLDGASSFIEIVNNNINEDRELVIFRDSFASSLSPLLINYYSKITLIDNRYINSNNYLKLIEFNNQDIIFMYSTLLVNNSNSLKN